MANKAYVFDPLESPTLMSADVSSIRKFMSQDEEYRVVWAERMAEGVIAKNRKAKSVLRCTDPDLRNRIRKYKMGAKEEEFTKTELLVTTQAY